MAIWLIVVVILVAATFGVIIAAFQRYKRCPSDKVLVVYGKVGTGADSARSSKCIHGGAAFIWPVIQAYDYMDLTPIQIEIDLTGALSKQNIRISVPSSFTVGISTQPGIMENAAQRLLGLDHNRIRGIAEDIIFGQLRVVIATMDIEEINADRDKFIDNVTQNVGAELNKIGLELINVNAKDITDESGYISALGQRAAAEAINQAKREVAEKDRDGEIGAAEAKRDERIQVASADAVAVTGENTAKVTIANSDADRRVKEAEARRLGDAADKVKEADALREGYGAQREAEVARAERDRATQFANSVVPAEINKAKIEVDADAQAEKLRREAMGEGDAIYARMQGEARGIYEILSKQAEGLQKIVAAAGGDPDKAAMLLIVDKLPELVRTQVDAISGIKFDNITVWDSGGKGDGVPDTARFAKGMFQALPPLQDLLGMAGMNLPNWVATSAGNTAPNGAAAQEPSGDDGQGAAGREGGAPPPGPTAPAGAAPSSTTPADPGPAPLQAAPQDEAPPAEGSESGGDPSENPWKQ
jgi:flotillin